MRLVVGLGNPGREYEATRHNAGFWWVENLAEEQRAGWKSESRFHGRVGRLSSGGEDCWLLLPQTFMNRSGVAVAALLQEHGATAADLVVVYDDLDLPLGRIRIRTNGSAGGHRGVTSIIEHLGAVPFCRIRLGIGRPPAGVSVIDYVLAPFDEVEMIDVSKVVDRAIEALDGTTVAMGVYNRAG